MVIVLNSFEFQLLFVFTLTTILIKIIVVIYLANVKFRIYKKQGKFSLDFIFGFIIFIICLIITRIILLYYDFYLVKFDPEAYYIEPNLTYWRVAQFIAGLGLVTLLFITEKTVLMFKTKGILTCIFFPLNFINLLYPVNSAEDMAFLNLIGAIIFSINIFIPLVFYYIGFKTPGLRKMSFNFANGIILYCIGIIIVGEAFIAPFSEIYGPQIRFTMHLFSILVKAFGLYLFSMGIKGLAPKEKEEKAKNYQKKKEYITTRRIQEESKRKFIKLISKTEEEEVIIPTEVSFLPEHTFCIVCKSKLAKFVNVYICPECDCHYCEKCARSIIDLENQCWVCNEPIDEKKPSKPIKEEIEDVIIENKKGNLKK